MTLETHSYGTNSNSAPTPSISIDEAVNRIGMGAFQRRILVAAGLCFAADSMEILLLSFLSVVLQAAWELSETETALLTAVVFWGALIGTAILGPLGDVIGRKPVFLGTAALITTFGIATAAVTNFPTLVVMRFGVGFGVGGLTVPFDTLAEFVPTSHRGRDLMVVEYFWTAGTLLVPVAAFVTLESNSESGWRYFVILCALPCLISTMVGLLVVPESPRWLVTQGKHDQAIKVLRKAAACNGHDPMALFPADLRIADAKEEHKENAWDLFSPKWRKTTFFLWVAWAGFAFCYYGTIMVVTMVFAEIDEDADNNPANGEDAEYQFDYGAILASACSEIAGTTIVLFLIDRVGRIPTQAVSYTLGGCMVCALCFLANNSASRASLIIAGFLARMAFMSASCTTWVSTAEILTTDIRTTGHSAANAIARLGGSASPFLISRASLSWTGSILLVTSVITAMATLKLPETNGKSMGAGAAETEMSSSIQKEEATKNTSPYGII